MISQPGPPGPPGPPGIPGSPGSMVSVYTLVHVHERWTYSVSLTVYALYFQGLHGMPGPKVRQPDATVSRKYWRSWHVPCYVFMCSTAGWAWLWNEGRERRQWCSWSPSKWRSCMTLIIKKWMCQNITVMEMLFNCRDHKATRVYLGLQG